VIDGACTTDEMREVLQRLVDAHARGYHRQITYYDMLVLRATVRHLTPTRERIDCLTAPGPQQIEQRSDPTDPAPGTGLAP